LPRIRAGAPSVGDGADDVGAVRVLAKHFARWTTLVSGARGE
jgi:hypothetical protein